MLSAEQESADVHQQRCGLENRPGNSFELFTSGVTNIFETETYFKGTE